MSKLLCPNFQEFRPKFRQVRTVGDALAPQLLNHSATLDINSGKSLQKKQNIQVFQLGTPAISAATPLHWIIYFVNNNLKNSCLLDLWEIHNSNPTYLVFSRLDNLAELLKDVCVKRQDPHDFRQTNIKATTNEKVWGQTGTVKRQCITKSWRTGHLSQSERPSLQVCSEQRPTNVLAQLELQTTQ